MWRFSGLACEMILVRPTGFLFSGRRGGGCRQLRFGFVFQWSAQRAREGFRNFFSMVRPTGPGGFVFQWFAQRVCGVRVVFFFNGSPNGSAG